MNLLEGVGIVKEYFSATPLRKGHKICAVDNVFITIRSGETLGLVGESGCGKSTLGRLLVRLEKPTRGKIFFGKTDITHLPSKKIRDLRKRVQVVFQNNYTCLNPRLTVSSIIEEPLLNFKVGTAASRQERVKELLELVGLDTAYCFRYPHELSGGERQRINIARALALQPEMMICDEPVSSLDVSVQAQILNLLKHFKEDFGLTYLFISHDLATVSYLSERIAVMYLGKIVETFRLNNLVKQACHPYTRSLINAVPAVDRKRKKGILQPLVCGDPFAGSAEQFKGCRFYHRCPSTIPRCTQEDPALRSLNSDHQLACHLF